MPELSLLGRRVRVAGGTTVLSALQNAGVLTLRRSLAGEPRGALCGMGVCFECRVRVNGEVVRACQTPCADGQSVALLEDGLQGTLEETSG